MSVFIRKHERKHRLGGVTRADMQFQGIGGSGNDDLKKHLVAPVALGAGFDHRHHGDVVQNSLDVLSSLGRGRFDNRPHRIGAGHVMFPDLADSS